MPGSDSRLCTAFQWEEQGLFSLDLSRGITPDEDLSRRTSMRCALGREPVTSQPL